MSERRKHHAIFLAFDEGFASHAQVCLNSLRRNYPDYPSLLVYYEGDRPATVDFLRSFQRLRLIRSLKISELVQQFHLGINNHPAVYYKYEVWSPAFEEFDNILYLDADTIVLKPLDTLLETGSFFAVANRESEPSRVFYRDQLSSDRLLKLLARDGLSALNEPDDMCNAGVLVVPRQYRTEGHFDQLCAITKEYDASLQFADQSAISIWCKINALELSDRIEYNYEPTLFRFPENR